MCIWLTAVLNLLTRPASGALGLAVLPFQGLAADIQTAFRRTPEAVYRSPRFSMSFTDAAKLSETEKDEIVRCLEVLRQETQYRRRETRRKRHRLFLTGQKLISPHTPTHEEMKELQG